MRILAIALLISSLGYAGVAWGGLIWQEEVTAKASGLQDFEIVTSARYYCDTLDFEGSARWRLPTATELVEFLRQNPNLKPSGLYWSSTPVVSNRHEGWAVDSRTGTLYLENLSMLHWVRCVRD